MVSRERRTNERTNERIKRVCYLQSVDANEGSRQGSPVRKRGFDDFTEKHRLGVLEGSLSSLVNRFFRVLPRCHRKRRRRRWHSGGNRGGCRRRCFILARFDCCCRHVRGRSRIHRCYCTARTTVKQSPGRLLSITSITRLETRDKIFLSELPCGSGKGRTSSCRCLLFSLLLNGFEYDRNRAKEFRKFVSFWQN